MIFITDEIELTFVWDKYPIYGLYFYRSDMMFHGKILNIIKQIQEKYPDVLFCALDADQFRGPCVRFEVRSVPTVIILKNAKQIGKIEGSVKTQEFVDLFDDICIPVVP